MRHMLKHGQNSACILILSVVVGTFMGSAWLVTHHQVARAADNSYTHTVLFLHGFAGISGTGSSGSQGTVDCSYFAPLRSQISSSTGFATQTIGFYSKDTCDSNLASLGDPHGCATVYGAQSTVGTTNEPIESIACKLSWFIYDSYSRLGANHVVDIIAHSMGGIIVRTMMQYTGTSTHGWFAPVIYVGFIGAIAAPNGGVSGAAWANFFNLAYQATQLDAGNLSHPSSLLGTLNAETSPPRVAGGLNTIWLNMSSQCDDANVTGDPGVGDTTALNYFPGGEKIDYVALIGTTADKIAPCGNSLGTTYTHGGYLQETAVSGSFKYATFLSCSGCSTMPSSPFSNGEFPQEVIRDHLQTSYTMFMPSSATPVPPTATPLPPSTAWCTDLYYASNWLTGLAGGSQIATTFTVHYAYTNGACTVTYVQSVGQGNINTAGTLRSDLFQCTTSGCGNIVVGGPYGPPIPFHSGWYGATIQANQLLTVFTTNGGATPYFCLQADGMYQQAGSSAQQFVWTPGAPGLCYPRVWPSTSAPSPTTPPVVSTPPSLDGWIEGANGLLVSGWACDDANGGATSYVDFYIDAPAGQSGSSYVGGTTATGNRPDLVAAGVCGRTPNHGYQYYARVPKGTHIIWAYNVVSGTSKVLNGSGSVIVDNSPSCPPTRCS